MMKWEVALEQAVQVSCPVIGDKSIMLANMDIAVDTGRPDPFFDLIKTCKEDNLPGGREFIRSVTCRL